LKTKPWVLTPLDDGGPVVGEKREKEKQKKKTDSLGRILGKKSQSEKPPRSHGLRTKKPTATSLAETNWRH